MPGLSGIELAQEIRAERPQMPLILVSGNADLELRKAAARVGIEHFMDKPVFKVKLAKAVREVLER